MEQDTGALPRHCARLAVRARPTVPPRTKAQQQRLSRRTTPAASSTTLMVPDTTGVLPACPVRRASEPLADYFGRLQVFTDTVAAAKAQQEAAEAERQRLANEAAAQTQQTVEADAAARDQQNAASTESLIHSESQWTTFLQGMIFVPSDAQADPTPAEAERTHLANLMLGMMRGIMWNNTLLQAHLRTERQQRQKYQQDIAYREVAGVYAGEGTSIRGDYVGTSIAAIAMLRLGEEEEEDPYCETGEGLRGSLPELTWRRRVRSAARLHEDEEDLPSSLIGCGVDGGWPPCCDLHTETVRERQRMAARGRGFNECSGEKRRRGGGGEESQQ
ncbi:hypothetical protein CBR_g84868 [Chara braunii]|uniref:Uncharacterized protein n=1 Tax=Chara braunii TaxID=69332 RepID=A0A388KAW8_CHABU|nr:hypothetical protein CBR_g84868 [Chara braunii]|eukprot:GBG67205.1 hypothetical protein CBR_g84868 [Chara braunii]